MQKGKAWREVIVEGPYIVSGEHNGGKNQPQEIGKGSYSHNRYDLCLLRGQR
ncbi:hypothetical protein ES703_42231 [subsurface metagenome]